MTVDGQPSWDAERAKAPKRPEFASSLRDEELIDRPRLAIVALVFAVLATAVCAAMAIAALADLDGIRESLVAALPDDLRETYEQEDQEAAASVMLGSVGVLGGLLIVVQLAAMWNVVIKRSRGARTGHTVFAALLLPVTLLAAALASAELLLAAAAVGCLVIAVVLSWTPRVSRWLRQGDPRRTIPIADRHP